jgi:YegS/Rv2252/BmrU family lipid kinase
MKEENMMTKRLCVVVNPAAGQPKPVLHTLNSVCGNAGVDWAIFVTRKSGDAFRFAQEALADGFDVVAAFGGDGTVMEVASALMGGDAPAAILPGGTANVMSTELGIPGDLTQACQLACGQNSTTRRVDMGQAGRRTFMLRVATGLDADHVIGATREMKDRYGELAYTISALRQMTHLQTARYRLTLDGENYEVEGATCRVDNSGNFGHGLSFSKEISVSDGLLDVTIVRDLGPTSVQSLVSDAVGHRTANSDAFHHWQAREITIEADPPQHVIGDGELWGETPISLKVLPQAVRFVVPEP